MSYYTNDKQKVSVSADVSILLLVIVRYNIFVQLAPTDEEWDTDPNYVNDVGGTKV